MVTRQARDMGSRRSWKIPYSPYETFFLFANCKRTFVKLHLCRTEEPGVLQSRGSQRVECDLATEQQQQSREGGICEPLASRTPSSQDGPISQRR